MVALTLADRPLAHGPEHAPLGGRRSREQKVAVRLAHGISQRVRRGRRVRNAEHAHLSHTVTDSITRGYSLIIHRVADDGPNPSDAERAHVGRQQCVQPCDERLELRTPLCGGS